MAVIVLAEDEVTGDCSDASWVLRAPKLTFLAGGVNVLPAGEVVTAVGVDTALSEVVERFVRYAGGLGRSRNCGM